MDRSAALTLLRQAVGDPDAEFRTDQWEAIDALVNRRQRLLLVERTGWGKSAVYFVATRMLRDAGRGFTLIVSPLLALMRDQVRVAGRLGIHALTINSSNTETWSEARQTLLDDRADALLISPERLANEDFMKDVMEPIRERIGLFVMDEAHCISDWGHDFRPDYRRLTNILMQMPANLPILGTTATANDRVIADVRAQLGDVGVRRGPLTRQSLALQTMRLPSQAERLAWLADHIDCLPGTGIIYTLTTRDAGQVSDWLQFRGVEARAYYSGIIGDGFEDSNAYRLHLEKRLLANDLKALVATSALGMGYDKPDLGFVVHYQAPGSVIAYYQQVGRAGRAISHAVGILMAGTEDADIQDYFRRTAFPNEEWVNRILEVLEESEGLGIRGIEEKVNLTYTQIVKTLKFLSVEDPAPVIKEGSTWRRTAVAYRLDHEHIRRLTGQREIEWRELQEYIDAKGCLMEFLSNALDDPRSEPCGRCATCLGRSVVSRPVAHETVVAARRFLRQAELPLQCNRQVAQNAFPEYGFRGNLHSDLRAEIGRVLSRWQDAGWGKFVAEDKSKGRFRDALVEAAAQMVQNRWGPDPPPTWVTCVPSKARPDLVPDFAERLAARLSLPFRPVVEKVKVNHPQKTRQNRFQQCRNLDGVFEIVEPVCDQAVLLVDDIVDSGWTLTVVAALLRRAGSGPVWPLALATAGPGS